MREEPLKTMFDELLGPEIGAKSPKVLQPNLRAIVERILWDRSPDDQNECVQEIALWMAEQVKKGIQHFQFNETPHHITAAELFLRIIRGEKYNAENPKGYFTRIIKRKVLRWKQRREKQLNQLEQDDDNVFDDIPDHNDVEKDIDSADVISLEYVVKAFINEYKDPRLGENTIKAYRAMAGHLLNDTAKKDTTNAEAARKDTTNAEAAKMAYKENPESTHAENTLRAQFPRRMRNFIIRRFGYDTLKSLLD